MLKKILSLALVFGLVSIGTVSTLAADYEHEVKATEYNPEAADEGTITPFARVCICGNGTLSIVSTSYGDWVVKRQVRCTHHTYGTDLIEERTVVKTQKCNSCGRGITSTSTESRTRCEGYEYYN